MYSDYYSGSSNDSIFDIFQNSQTLAIVSIVCLILAVISGFLLFFLFLGKQNEGKFTGFLGWMYDFLNFKKMMSESILKVCYLILASFITLYAVGALLFTEGGSIGGRLLAFILTLTIGNVMIRLLYEFALVILIICRNTTEINKKMGDNYIEAQQNNNSQVPVQPTVPQGVVFCRNCGNNFNSNESLCPHCGKAKE